MKNFKKTIIVIMSLTTINNLLSDDIKLSADQVVTLQEQSFFDQWEILAAGDVTLISPKQIQFISTSIIPYITNDQIIKLTISQIQALTSAQIQALTPGQISALTVPDSSGSSVVNQIGAFTQVQIQSFTKKQIYGLSADHLAIIFDLLSEEQIAYLNSDQIQNLPTDQLTSMKLDQLGSFTVEQITDLTPYQLSQILTASTTTPQTSILSNLTDSQISGISVSQINGMPGNQRAELFNILSNQTDSENPNRLTQIEAVSQGGVATGPDIKIKDKSNDPEYKTASIEKIHAPGVKSLYDVNKASGLAQVNEKSEKDLKAMGRGLSGKTKAEKKMNKQTRKNLGIKKK